MSGAERGAPAAGGLLHEPAGSWSRRQQAAPCSERNPSKQPEAWPALPVMTKCKTSEPKDLDLDQNT